MLEKCYKVAGIIIAAVIVIALVVGPGISAIVWIVQLDASVGRLEEDVSKLNTDMEQVQDEIADLRAGQQEILHLLRELRDDFISHSAQPATHAESPAIDTTREIIFVRTGTATPTTPATVPTPTPTRVWTTAIPTATATPAPL